MEARQASLLADDNDRMTDGEKKAWKETNKVSPGASVECQWRGDVMMWTYYWIEE